MREGLLDLIGQAREWGVNLFRAAPSAAAAKEPALGVYCRTGTDEVLVGRLSREGEEFVFRYDPGYTGKTISAFPVRKPEYRSKRLWPFFAVRIPPFDRRDVREEIEKRSLDETQVIEILGLVATVSVANPYEFRLG